MSVAKRNNVQVRGSGSKAMVFAHGFGCDQNMWRFVAPEFERDYRTVLFDHVGAGHSDLNAYDPARYSSLQGYADDLLEIGRELRLENAVFVGHSVSAMIGALASLKDPAIFESLIMVGPSPRYIDDEEYKGGFSAQQIEELLSFLEENHPHFELGMQVYCNAPRIGQLFSNLLGNAITHGAPDAPIHVEARVRIESFELSIANAGQPISEKAMERLFRPFYRGEVRPSQQGLGLGLYIAAEIAKAHGGTLVVTSGHDETRFTFRMPLAQPVS